MAPRRGRDGDDSVGGDSVRGGHGTRKEEHLTGVLSMSAGGGKRSAGRESGWAGRLAGLLRCGAGEKPNWASARTGRRGEEGRRARTAAGELGQQAECGDGEERSSFLIPIFQSNFQIQIQNNLESNFKPSNLK